MRLHLHAVQKMCLLRRIHKEYATNLSAMGRNLIIQIKVYFEGADQLAQEATGLKINASEEE